LTTKISGHSESALTDEETSDEETSDEETSDEETSAGNAPDNSAAPKEEGAETPSPPAARYFANVHPGAGAPVPGDFAALVRALEETLGMPLYLFIQNGDNEYASISYRVWNSFFGKRHVLQRGQPVAVLLESPGGIAKVAYKMASLINRSCGSFTAVVPQYAKSAATLFALGADTIVMGEHAELGPLDAQIFDPDREGHRSALDEVQSIERLHAAALEAVDQSMIAWVRRSGKKQDTLLPTACTFVTDMMRPLFEKIDTVHYTQTARDLKEAEEYAVRLLLARYSPDYAKAIASHLVEKYPEHGFVIDAKEAAGLGLDISEPTSEQAQIMDAMMPYLDSLTVFGRLEEMIEK